MQYVQISLSHMYRRTYASPIALRAFAAKVLCAMADVALHYRWHPLGFPDVTFLFLASKGCWESQRADAMKSP
eukprot:1519368-Pyramimonas_sp.AAC.1